MYRILPTLCALGCAQALSLDTSSQEQQLDPPLATTAGGFEGEIDATSEESWVYVDLESGELVEPAVPEDDPSWDVAFLRFQVAINGGVSGTGGCEAAALDGVPFDEVLAAPPDGYTTDQEDDDGDGLPDRALGSWYDYDKTTHELTPHDRTYVIRTVEGAHQRLRFDSYYDEAGTPAIYQLRWAPVESP